MGFLTSNFDLSQTVFSDSGLKAARSYLTSWIQKEEPSWLKKPQGPFGKYWKEDSVISACNLINFAHMLEKVTRNVTSESIPRLHKKVKDNLLPRPSDIKQFYETFAELEATYELVARVSPLTIEPPIPGQLRSPDITFQLPEGMMYLDVTVFRGGSLEKWEDATQRIREAIHARVLKRGKALNIDMQIGLERIRPDQIIKQVLDGIDESDVGEVPVGSKGIIRWEPCPTVDWIDNSSVPDIPSFAGIVRSLGASSSGIRRAVASQATLTLPSLEDVEKINELLFNALRNKLKGKHKQFPRNQPAFYVMKIGHRGVTVESMLRALQDLWTGDDYRWITGVIIFSPRQGFFTTDSRTNLTLSANPYAKCPASGSFWSIFKEGAQFYY